MRIFLSYSEDDLKLAQNVYQRLQDAGFNPWMSCYDIPPGIHWDRAIHAALRSTDQLVLVHTEASFNSDNCWDEWSYFLNRGKPIFPLIFDDFDLPFRLERVQHINFCTQNFQHAMIQLLDCLQSASHGRPMQEQAPSHNFGFDNSMLMDYEGDDTESAMPVETEEERRRRILRERQERHVQRQQPPQHGYEESPQPRSGARAGLPRGLKR